MEIIIKEDNLTVSHKLEPEWPNEVSPAEAMIAAYDVLSQIFGQKAVIDAYYRTDLDTMAVRDEDDDTRSYVSKFTTSRHHHNCRLRRRTYFFLVRFYFPMQELVELPNLLLYNVLLKLIFRFCPPFVHENKNLFFRGHFFI